MRVMRDEKGMRGIRGHKRYEREEGYEWYKRYEGSLRAQSSPCQYPEGHQAEPGQTV